MIRHGESRANVLQREEGGFFCGQWDCDLTGNGRSQAASLKNSAFVTDADAVYSSPLKRAADTAAAFAERDIIFDERLKERSMGVFEGRRRRELEQIEEYRKYFEDERYTGFRSSFTVPAPGGETYSDVVKRVASFLAELKTGNHKKAVIVSHIVAIRCMIKVINGLSEEETLKIKVKQCEPIVLRY